jgi:predicted HicB family RNase H-like nuclease
MAVSVSEMRLRQNLRLDPEMWERIDLQRTQRAGNISRNTWITEAILEKLLREKDNHHPRRSANA